MTAGSSNSPALLSPWWTLVLPLVTFGAMMSALPERRLSMAPAATAAFMLMQWVLPRCRFRTDHYMGPVNVALTLSFIQLVVIPALIMISGAESRVLTTLPSAASIQGAIWIQIAAHVALCVGLSLGPNPARRVSVPVAALDGPSPGGPLVMILAALGVVGFLAAFGSPAALVAYFLDSSAQLQNELEGSVLALAGTFLRPFLAFALVAWWANHVDAPSERRRLLWLTLAGAAAAIGVTIANLTFSFNRAAFMFPLASLAATYSSRVKHIPPMLTLVLLAVVLPGLMAIETLRSNRMLGLDTDAGVAFERVLKDASETVQGYGGGPQFSASFYDRQGWGEHLYGGSTLLASVMSPVPILGKGFRETSGPALFNRAIYDVGDIEDQIIPFAAELFVNFHLPGVLIGFIGLGIFLSSAQQWFKHAESTFAAFSIQYVAIWGAMLTAWSASVYSQILIYFFGPIYFYVAVRHALGWLRRTGRVAAPALRPGAAA